METEVSNGMEFDKLVRIYVDTDVDTHFIVSTSRTSSVAELRELIKVTHRHCYPNLGNVNIGKLAVPGGDYGYHLADYLRIGQVYDKWEGKVFAEVEDYGPAPIIGEGVFRMPAISYRTSPTPKKLHLLNNNPVSPYRRAGHNVANSSEKGSDLNPQNSYEQITPVRARMPKSQENFTVPKPHEKRLVADRKFSFVTDASGMAGKGDLLPEPHVPLSQPPELPSLVPVEITGITGEVDAKESEDRPGSLVAEAKPTRRKKEGLKHAGMCFSESHVDLDKVHSSQENEEVLGSTTQVGSRKRDASDCKQRVSKSRKLSEPAHIDSSLKKRTQNGHGVKEKMAIEVDKDQNLEINLKGKNIDISKDFSPTPSLQVNSSCDPSYSVLSGAGNKRRKKKGTNLELLKAFQKEKIIAKDEKLGIDHSGKEVFRSEKEDPKTLNLMLKPPIENSASIASGTGKKRKKRRDPDNVLIDSSGVSGNIVDKDKDTNTLLGGCETLVLKQVIRGDAGMMEKGVFSEVSTSMGYRQEERNGEAILKDVPFETSDCARGHLTGRVSSSNLESPAVVVKDEKDDIPHLVNGKKKKKKKKKKKGSISTSSKLDKSSSLKGDADLERPCVGHSSVLQASKSQPPAREVQSLKNAFGEDLKNTGKMAVQMMGTDDKVISIKGEHLFDGIDAEKSTSDEGDAVAVSQDKVESANELAQDKSIESLEIPESPRPLSGTKAGRGAPLETFTPESLGEEKKLEKSTGEVGNKTGEGQGQSSKSSMGNLKGRNLRSNASAASPSESKAGKNTEQLRSSNGESQQRVGHCGKDADSSSSSGESSGQSEPRGPGEMELESNLREVAIEEGRKLPAKQTSHAESGSSTGDSSGESGPRGASTMELERQFLEGRNSKAEQSSLAFKGFKSPEKQVSILEKSAGFQLEIFKISSLEAFSQDQSFHVTPTQVDKALSGSTTEESDDESDRKVFEGTDKSEKKEAIHSQSSVKEAAKSDETDQSRDSKSSRSTDSGSMATRTPAPMISRMRTFEGNQNIKRRASGGAEIEAKFAQFIDSQDGLDEIMGITLSQRNRSLPVEPVNQAGGLGAPSIGCTMSPAAATGSLKDIVLSTQDKSMDNLTNVDRSLVSLGSRKAGKFAELSAKSAEKSSTREFKVPKPVPVKTTPGAVKGAIKSTEMQRKTVEEVSPRSSSADSLPLKKTDTLEYVTSKEKSEPQVEMAGNPLTKDGSEQPVGQKDVPSSSSLKQKSTDLLLKPQSESERMLDHHSAAEESNKSSEKSSEKRKRSIKKKEELQFMVVNNVDQLLEQERKRKGSKDKENGPAHDGLQTQASDIQPGGDVKISPRRLSEEERGPSYSVDASFVSSKKSGKKQKEGKVKREDVESSLNASRDISAVESVGKKKRRKMKFAAEETEGHEVNNLPETSVDRSARETEELYLKLEKANRDLWLQQSESSLKKEKGLLMSTGNSGAEVDDNEVAKVEGHSQVNGGCGETEVDDTGSKKVLATEDILMVGESEGCDLHKSPHLLAGNTEASDREEDVFPSQGAMDCSPIGPQDGGTERCDCLTDERVERHQLYKTQKTLPNSRDIFDFVSGDEIPTPKAAKSAKKSGQKKAKRMEEVSERAVERVLEDEMLHVADPEHVPGKKLRKDVKPQKWAVRMRGSLPKHAIPTSALGGGSSTQAAEGQGGAQIDENIVKAEDLGEKEIKKKDAKTPKTGSNKSKNPGAFPCPGGCGKTYAGKTSAWYVHKNKCTGAPA